MRQFRVCVVLALLAICAGCGDAILGSGDSEAIPRLTFQETMVELRLEAYRANDQGILPEGAHEAILTRHGVSVDEMIEFIEVHGRDIPFMDSVWTDIDGHVRAGLQAQALEIPPTLPLGEPQGATTMPNAEMRGL
jgi:hypothetical protein